MSRFNARLAIGSVFVSIVGDGYCWLYAGVAAVTPSLVWAHLSQPLGLGHYKCDYQTLIQCSERCRCGASLCDLERIGFFH